MKYLSVILKLIMFLLVIHKVIGVTPQFIEGVDYVRIKAGSSSGPQSPVNVKEFFSFSCIHCKEIEPLIETMVQNNHHILMQKIQVTWDPITKSFAQLNATLELLHLQRLYVPIFNSIATRNLLMQPQELQTFLLNNGLNNTQIKNFMLMYNSFTVAHQVNTYNTLQNLYNINATPIFIVADQYQVTPATAEKTIAVLNVLINKVQH